MDFTEAATGEVLWEKVFLEISQNSQENTCASLFFNKLYAPPCNFIRKETLAQVFSSEFYELSQDTFFIEHLQVTAFGFTNITVVKSS